MTVGGVSAAVSKTAAAPIERVKLLIQNQVSTENLPSTTNSTFPAQILKAYGGLLGFELSMSPITGLHQRQAIKFRRVRQHRNNRLIRSTVHRMR